MAQAEKTTVKQVVTTEVPGVTLTLTEVEARALLAICSKVGGSPERSPRGWINNISKALNDAGMGSSTDETSEYRALRADASLWFSDYRMPINFPADRAANWGG